MKGASLEEGTALQKLMLEGVVNVETQRFRVDPMQSYVPKETRAEDPAFWMPKNRLLRSRRRRVARTLGSMFAPDVPPEPSRVRSSAQRRPSHPFLMTPRRAAPTEFTHTGGSGVCRYRISSSACPCPRDPSP